MTRSRSGVQGQEGSSGTGRRLPGRWRRLVIPLAVVLVGVLLQVVPEVPLLPDLATEAKADPPTLSGAEPAYPLNHTIDGDILP